MLIRYGPLPPSISLSLLYSVYFAYVDGDYLDIVQFNHISSVPEPHAQRVSSMPTLSNRCNPAADVGCCGEFQLRGHKDYAVTRSRSKHLLLQQPSYNPPFQINFFSEHNCPNILQIWLPKDLKSHLSIHPPSRPSDPTMSARTPSRNTSNLAPIPKNSRIATFS